MSRKHIDIPLPKVEQFYLHLSNGDTDIHGKSKEEILDDLDFEMSIGMSWGVITDKPISTKTFLALMDLLRDKRVRKESAKKYKSCDTDLGKFCKKHQVIHKVRI